MTACDVSVVVISYNDAGRLPRAIRSVQRQTLRALEIVVVDDASSDDTESVVRRLAASDARIRYERLPANSGGCSAPRNRGIELARAPWVMFCDSDDEYERHACKNLLLAAERNAADVVCGAAERVDTRNGRAKRWRPEVHDVERVADGLADYPELLFDTISVNKIYRRDLLVTRGIRFPEGLLFEDQLFTLEAMAAATRIASIPETVYRWYVDRISEEPSITQRRNEARNVESRIEINRRIDTFLEDPALAHLQEVKDFKFLKHDLYLYLASMIEVDDETARMLMDRLAPYVEGVNLAPAWRLRPALRVAIYHLLMRDLEGIRSAMRFIKWASVVDMPIVARDGGQWWGCEHLVNGPDAGGIPAARWLDVTELRLLDIPFTQRRYLHRVESISVDRGRVTATGSTVDYAGGIEMVPGVELRLLVNGERTLVSVPAVWTGHDGLRRSWRAEGAPSTLVERHLALADHGTLGVALVDVDHVNVTSARSDEASMPRARVGYPGRVRWTGPDALELTPNDNGAVGWRAVRAGRGRVRLAAMRDAWFRLPGTTPLARAFGFLRREGLGGLADAIGGRLPRRPLAVFEANRGRTFDGNTRAISEALWRVQPEISQAWVFRGDPTRVPHYAMAVEARTLTSRWTRSRARYWIDDGGTESTSPKPAATISVFAGTGVPVHRVGLDDPSVLVSRTGAAAVRRRSRGWDLLVAASGFDAEISVAALDYRGPVVEAGLPRIDGALSSRPHEPTQRTALRTHLDLPPDRQIVLYAPTARRMDRGPADALIDLERWAEALGDRTYLLVRSHPLDVIAVPTRVRSAVRDLATEDNLAEYLVASDLFVSDYSSLIGDAALVDLPIVLYQPDREIYVNRTRGVYPGLDAVGPVVTTMGELVSEVLAWLDDGAGWDARFGPDRRRWSQDRCGPDDGGASRRVLEAMLAAGSRR